MDIATLREGFHIFSNSMRVHFHGKSQYEGDAKRICEQIVQQCWNRKYYQTSLHNYTGFYARDFGMCVDSLLLLGKKREVILTLNWALSKYKKEGKITQQINDLGVVFSYPAVPQPDALAFILHALDAVRDDTLIEQYREFLQQQVIKLVVDVIDTKTLLVKTELHVAGMRDHAIRQSSCYDNVMMLAVQKYCHRLGLTMPLHIPKKLLVEKFWTGSYFIDDIKSKAITGDANVVPFWFGVVDSTLFSSAVMEIEKNKLNHPFSLRYESHVNHEREMIWETAMTDGWEHDTVWLHLGNMYLQVLSRHDKKKARVELDKHRVLIEKERNYPEVLSKEGVPQKSFFFAAEDSMLWACNFIALSKTLDKK